MSATLVAPQAVPAALVVDELQRRPDPDPSSYGDLGRWLRHQELELADVMKQLGLWVYPEAEAEQYRQEVKRQVEAKLRQRWRFASLVGVLCIAVILGAAGLVQGVGAISSPLIGITLLLALVLPTYYLYSYNRRPESWKTHTWEEYLRTLAPDEVVPDAVQEIIDRLERHPTRYQLRVQTFDADPLLYVVDSTTWRCAAIWGEPAADAPLIGCDHH